MSQTKFNPVVIAIFSANKRKEYQEQFKKEALDQARELLAIIDRKVDTIKMKINSKVPIEYIVGYREQPLSKI